MYLLKARWVRHKGIILEVIKDNYIQEQSLDSRTLARFELLSKGYPESFKIYESVNI